MGKQAGGNLTTSSFVPFWLFRLRSASSVIPPANSPPGSFPAPAEMARVFT